MRSIILFCFIALISIPKLLSQDGSIRGTVYDQATGEYLPGVTIYVEATSKGTITDLDGKFNLSISEGSYNLRVSFISYEVLNFDNVQVKAGEVTLLDDLGLKVATVELNEVVVRGKVIRNTETALLALKRKSPNLIDGISATNLRKIGDSDAANSMKRVTGISVSGGKYVYVRGLGDRYTKTTLNGVDIPGLDPDRNSLQMDIFPTNIINDIVVHKSFSAELPADFTGGIVNIEIKDFPEKREGKFTLGAGYNPSSHFNSEYLTYKGGGTDFLGFDDGTRAIPATTNIPSFAEVVGNPNGEKAQRYQEILSAFNQNMAVMPSTSFMDYKMGLSFGDQKNLEKVTIGYNFALSYRNTTDFYANAEDGRYGLSGDPNVFEMQRREFQTGSYGVNNVLLSGTGGFAIKTDKSKYRINLLHLQNGESKAGVFDFIGSDQGSEFIAIQHGLDYSQRSLSNVLLDGKHSLKGGKWNISWKLSPTLSKIYDPDIRFSRYEVNDDGSFRIGTEVGFPERIWRDLNEINIAGLVHVSKEFTFNSKRAKLNFGSGYVYKNRDYVIRNYALNIRNIDDLTGDPDELLSSGNLWPRDGDANSGTAFETPFIPNNPNQYGANSENFSVYLSTELGLSRRLRTVLGVRFENYSQYYSGTDQQKINVLENEKVLGEENFMRNFQYFPSINFIYSVNEKQNIRLSYTSTIARPSFKELSYAEIYDPITGITFIGGLWEDRDDIAGVTYWDGKLIQTNIYNFDLRWEWFGSKGQMFSASGFYKIFKNPIELVQYTKQIGSFQSRNVGDGKVLGGELELRQNFGFISEKLSGFSVASNVTLTKSTIKLSNTEYESRVKNARTGQTIEEYRDMAGQAPYIINAGLSYSGTKEGFWQGFEAGLYYNVQGITLAFVGVADRPDIYTKAFNSLNFNSNISLGKAEKFSLGIKIENILGQREESVYKSFKATEQIFRSKVTGRSFSLSLRYKFL